MPNEKGTFKPRRRSFVREDNEPIMLPGNGHIIRGVVPYRGDDYFDEDIDESVRNNWQLFSGRRGAATTRGRGNSTFHSTRWREGQGTFVDLTEPRHESGKGSTDSDEPLTHRAQSFQTQNNASSKTTEGPARKSKSHSPIKGTTASKNTSITNKNEPKFLSQAQRDYPVARPPFVRLNRNKGVLGPKRVILATPDGQFPQTEIPETLAV